MLANDRFKAVQAFAEARTDGFWVQIQRVTDFVIAQVTKIAQFNDFAAGFIQQVEGAMDLNDLLCGDQLSIRAGSGRRQIEGKTVLRILGIQGKRDLPAAAFGRITAFAIIASFIGGDAEEPGLKLAAALKSLDVLDNGEKNLLANLLGIFTREIVGELENESGSGGVMEIEQFVPGRSVAATAATKQFGFAVRAHSVGSLFNTGAFEQIWMEGKILRDRVGLDS